VCLSTKVFKISLTLLWQPREAAINVWHWTADISMEDFLDTYLFYSFKQRGVVLCRYVTQDHQETWEALQSKSEGVCVLRWERQHENIQGGALLEKSNFSSSQKKFGGLGKRS
jgi:hypothetical protein